MPYPNEHAARIKDPSLFQKDSFRRKNIAPGINIIIGKLKGQDTTTTQAYRFNKNKFTAEQARKWLDEHNIKPILFEKAVKAFCIKLVNRKLSAFSQEEIISYIPERLLQKIKAHNVHEITV